MIWDEMILWIRIEKLILPVSQWIDDSVSDSNEYSSFWYWPFLNGISIDERVRIRIYLIEWD